MYTSCAITECTVVRVLPLCKSLLFFHTDNKYILKIEMAAKRCYGTENAIAFIFEPGSNLEMSDLENSDDETDETYIPPEFENERDCDEVSDETSSYGSIDQNKDNDNNENGNTEKLSDGQHRDKSTDPSTDDSVAEKICNAKIKKKQPDHKW